MELEQYIQDVKYHLRTLESRAREIDDWLHSAERFESRACIRDRVERMRHVVITLQQLTHETFWAKNSQPAAPAADVPPAGGSRSLDMVSEVAIRSAFEALGGWLNELKDLKNPEIKQEDDKHALETIERLLTVIERLAVLKFV